jgi:type II secretion system protein D
VVITENTSLIRKLIDLKKEIDKPSSQVATRFIKVQFADVTELADTLTELLTAQASAQKTAGIQRADAPAAPTAPTAPGAPAARVPGQPGASSSGEETPVQIIPEPRTNRIFAMGRPVDLLFVEGLVREFDVQTSDKIYLRRKLRFLAVSDFLPIAGDALTRAFSGSSEGGSAASGGSNKAGAGGQSNRSQTGSRNNSSGSRTNSSGSRTASNNSSSGFGGSGSGSGSGGSGGSGGGSSSLSDPNVSSAPESMLIGRTLLVADNITNTIVAQGPPSGLEIIERLLDQIDVKPDQVMISTVIGQLSLNEGRETGFSYLFNGTDIKGGGGGGFPSFKPATTPTAVTFPEFDPSGLAGSGLRLYGKAGDLGIFMKALQSNSDFTVLSRPSIFTSNNQKGTISSGKRIALITGTNTYGSTINNNNSSSSQIQYQDVMLKLEVIPLVNSNNEITMQIALLDDEQSGSQTLVGAGNNGEDLTVPLISTREILTTVTVHNNETIVLGGLISNNDSKEKSGVPILSDIPLLGKLFSTTTTTKDRSELMIFLQPSIVNNNGNLNDVQTDMDSRYKISPNARKFADGPGVLPEVNAIPRVEPTGKNSSAPKAQVVKESKTKKKR